MNKYIFITAEGSTYQPNSDCSEPDIENMQVMGFGQGYTARDAIKKLLKMNEYLVNTDFNEIIAIQLADDHREYFSLKDINFKHTVKL
jgi:hypothetical protein